MSATSTHTPSNAAFDRTTTIWGNITLGVGLILATSLPFYLLFFSNVNVTAGQILAGFAAVAAVYGVFWFVEPLTYFPILGSAGMYQAFMIGNIANKLVPSAIVAQDALGVKPGTRKASYVATAAICGAATVHVVSMLLFVGLLGSWVVSITPPAITEVAQLYILPAILGGVVVQLAVSLKQGKATLIALLCAAFVILGLVTWLPVLKPVGTAITVVLTIILTWLLRDRSIKPGDSVASGQSIN